MAPEQRLGLTLSGGGFRATLFHLGVVRLLHDAGILTRVKRIGAVSGGSILAAHLVLNWDRYLGDEAAFDSAAQEVIRFVQHDVRGRVVRRWLLAWLPLGIPRLLLRKRWTFANLLQRQYAELYKEKTLGDLRAVPGVDRPQVFFYCTSLSTGAVCSFGRSGFMWDDEDEESNVVVPMTPVAYAVTASSAFPPLFPPVAISNETLVCSKERFPNSHYLSDGGVYDNLGIDRLIWYHRQRNDLDAFIISDAEGKFDADFDARYKFPISRNVRASNVLMKRVSALQYQSLSLPEKQLAVIDIAEEILRPDDASVLDPAIQRIMRNVRTDLDAFTPKEIGYLIQHGYTVAREVLEGKGLLPAPAPAYSWKPVSGSVPSGQDEIRVMRKSKARKLRVWSWRDWASWASVAVVGVLGLAMLAPAYLRNQRLNEELAANTKQLSELDSVNQKLNAVALDYFKKRHRPIEPGTSVGYGGGSDFVSTGTICCVVKLKSDGAKRYLLSADHIIAPPGSAIGVQVWQPGSLDGGGSADAAARLSKVLRPRSGVSNGPLGAIAELLPGVEATNVISGLGPIRGVDERVTLGQNVFVVGRTTGIGKAVVEDLDLSVKIQYDSGPILVDGLIQLRAATGHNPTHAGDSGAPILTEGGKLIGIIFAGSAEKAQAIPIRPLFDALGVELY